MVIQIVKLESLIDRDSLEIDSSSVILTNYTTMTGASLYKHFDTLEGHEFEYYCAELLKKRGFIDVTVTKGSGDYGVDVLAEKEGVTYAIQCKAYTTPVGVKAVQEAYAGREFYDRMVGAVLTNQYFTKPAVEAAKKLKILLWDRGYLDSVIEEE